MTTARPLATCCPDTSHSPKLVAGTGWTCPDCDQGRKPSPLARIHAAIAERDAGKSSRPKSKIPEAERALFVAALRQAARNGLVRQNDVRPLVRGRIYHKHIGSLWTWALACGLVAELDREPSTDAAGRNTHHDSGIYRWMENAA